MTLKELVMQVSFEELLPYLKAMIKGHDNSVYAFREAYDRLRLMEPNPEYKGVVRVEWSGGDLEDEERWIGVHYLDNARWKDNLSKEIVVADDVHLSLEELVAHCLWEITFYGFSEDEIGHTFDRMLGREKPKNSYDIALKKFNASIWKRQTPRKYRCVFRGMLCFQGDSLKYHLCCLHRKNRSKRKRAYRQERRKAYLKKMSTRLNMVETLTVPGSSFTRQDVEFLMSIEKGMSYDYTSITGNAEGRLAYIADSMTKYQQLDRDGYDNAIVCIIVSSKYPLAEVECREFQAKVRSFLKYEDIRFGTVQTDNDSKEVEVKLLLSKL